MSQHTFHIPVMGTGFTIDTPVKVARFGISSVISLDDILIEQMREFYCKKTGEEYIPIHANEEDARAKRITAYLNLMNRMVKKQITELKTSGFEEGSDLGKYFELLPNHSPLKQTYHWMKKMKDGNTKFILQDLLRSEVRAGAIDVNIMTKLDKMNYAKNGEMLPSEYSDALAALRGFALSELNSSVVFSAGMNPRLYGYLEQFKDFFPDENGNMKKKVILKVSDFRSAFIQGKFLAKKGIWVSEFRIESGLNCGGHAFATDGYLLGTILEEFKTNREKIISELHEIYNKALEQKGYAIQNIPHPMRITVQGGIGTAKEHNFLLNYFEVEATGWGTPFLLVPEVTNVDDETLVKLAAATEDDLYISDVSPLGVPFSNLRNSASEMQKAERVREGKPGSPCVKKYLVFNTEFTERPICVASHQYQKAKINELHSKNLTAEEFDKAYWKIVEKSCICDGLGVGAERKIGFINKQKTAPAICPGPNLAYFSKISTMEEMVNHIYGRISLLNSTYRPNMFIKELSLYIDYLKKEFMKNLESWTEKQSVKLNDFKTNLQKGIDYYKQLIPKMHEETEQYKNKMREELNKLEEYLKSLTLKKAVSS